MKNDIIELTKLYLEQRDGLTEEERNIILNTLKMFQMVKLEPLEIPELPLNEANTCSKCGMLFKGVMGYSCSKPDCPMMMNFT